MDTLSLLDGRMNMNDILQTLTIQYVVISVLITKVATNSTTTVATGEGGMQPIETDFPQSVLVLIGLGLCLLIGIVVAKLVDKLHDRVSLRDDASDMSEHTRDLLKARFALSAFASNLGDGDSHDSRTREIDRARKYGRLWMAHAANARRKKREVKLTINTNHDGKGTESEKLSPKVALVSFKPKEETIKETKEEYDPSEKDTISDKDFVSVDMTMEDSGQIGNNMPKKGDVTIEFRDIGDGVTIPVRVSLEDKKEVPSSPIKLDPAPNGRLPSSLSVSSPRKSADLKDFSSTSDFGDFDDTTVFESESPTKPETPAPRQDVSIPKETPDSKTEPKKPDTSVSTTAVSNASPSKSKPVKDAWKEQPESKSSTARPKTPAPSRPATSVTKSPKAMRPVSSKAGSRPLTAGSRKITPGARKGSVRGGTAGGASKPR